MRRAFDTSATNDPDAPNQLGHFALTARLLSLLRRGADARVVTVSSVMHKTGRIDFDDLQCERRRYSPTRTYKQAEAREPAVYA